MFTLRALLASALLILGQAHAQRTSASLDLEAPDLRPHGDLPAYNPPGMPLPGLLAEAKLHAGERGVAGRGMDFIIPHVSAGPTDPASVYRLYWRLTCLSDAVVIGHVHQSASHLSANGTTIYTDYDIVIDASLKSAASADAETHFPQAHIVATRPGGAMSLQGDQVTFEYAEFPRLTPGAAYLLFLRRIPQTGAYEARDSFSTLIAFRNQWTLPRHAFSPNVLPLMARGTLETTVATWATACK